MKKWIVAGMCALMLTAFVAIPSGCGSNEATKLTPTGDTEPQPEGHEQAAKEMNKKPSDAK